LGAGPAGRQAQRCSGGIGQQTGILTHSLHPLAGAGYRIEVLTKAKHVE